MDKFHGNQDKKFVRKVPVFIINYNRLTLPKNMADYLADCDGVFPVIVDNGSTYEPLLEYYKTCPHKVELMGSNWGQNVIWYCGILEQYGLSKTDEYILTDPDFFLNDIPKDFLHVLQTGLDRHQFACKAGFSIEINDIPESPLKPLILEWENFNWANKLDEMYYKASIDTTFCLMRARIHDFAAVRTERPYTMKHMQWYYTKENIPDDELYYLKTTSGCSTYSGKLREMFGIEFGV